MLLSTTLVADYKDCKDPIQNRHMVPTSWIELHIALLFFYFNIQSHNASKECSKLNLNKFICVYSLTHNHVKT